MTKDELKRHVNDYLKNTNRKGLALQAEICAAFIDHYSKAPQLTTIEGSCEMQESWVHSQIGAFSIGYISGMDRHRVYAEKTFVQALIDKLGFS